MNCEALYATDEFVVQLWPQVVRRAPERWQVVVLGAATGPYSATVGGIAYPMAPAAAVPPDTITTIRNRLLAALGLSLEFAASAAGAASVVIAEAEPGGLAVTASGPAPGTIQATLVSGGDINAAERAVYLKSARCGMPPCENFGCVPCGADDFTLMHAALAAHMVLYFGTGSIGKSGKAAADFKSMRLGPAALEKQASAWGKASPADAILDSTGPGQLYLMLRARYSFGIMCA